MGSRIAHSTQKVWNNHGKRPWSFDPVPSPSFFGYALTAMSCQVVNHHHHHCLEITLLRQAYSCFKLFFSYLCSSFRPLLILLQLFLYRCEFKGTFKSFHDCVAWWGPPSDAERRTFLCCGANLRRHDEKRRIRCEKCCRRLARSSSDSPRE